MTTTNRVLVFDSTKCRALANVASLMEGTSKDGKPAWRHASMSSLQDALITNHSDDSHVVAYYPTEPEGALGFHRLAKNTLAQIRALGGDVLCSSIFIDIDLHAQLGRPSKVSWESLTQEEADKLWLLFLQQVPGLPPPFAVYTTKNGARIVHPLLFDVKAGVAYEAVLARVHRAYLKAGIIIDESCSDWTRLYRLPKVIRSGSPTADEPWFRLHLNTDNDEVYLVPEEEDLALVDSTTIVRYTASTELDAPTDEECHAILFDDRNKPTEVLKSIRQRFRQHPLAPFLACQGALIPEGKRNDTIVAMAGLLSRSGDPIQVCYAVMVESAKLLSGDDPWRDIAWRKLCEFRAKDEATIRAEERMLPERLKKKGQQLAAASDQPDASTEPDAEPEPLAFDPRTGLRNLPKAHIVDSWAKEAADNGPVLSEKGQMLNTPHNAAAVLSSMGYEISIDIFSEAMRVSGPGLPKGGQEFDDFLLLRLLRLCGEGGFQVKKDTLYDYIRMIADANRHHPVIEYLTGLPAWDGKPRVEHWLTTYFGVKDSPYVRCVGAVTLVGAVRRVFEPGCKHDTVLILEGGQGGFKSTALKTLAVRDEWFTDNTKLDASSKEIIETVAGHWIVEAAEVVGIRKGDPDRLKMAISREKERARMSYDRASRVYQRQFIVFGTTNRKMYLTDDTGNRRYWPVEVGMDIDIDGLQHDRDQLWAEAVLLWRKGQFYVMPPELYADAAAEQDKRRIVKNEAEYEFMLGVLSEIDKGAFVVSDLWKAIGINNAGRRAQVINETLRDMGWRKHGSRHWVKGEGKLPVYDVMPLGEGAYKLRMTKETYEAR